MSKELDEITKFLDKHHVLSLATSSASEISVCSLFYTFIKRENSFIVASSKETLHIKHIIKNQMVAGTIVLETKNIGKIQGIQFRGECLKVKERSLKNIYFKAFPYALAMNPQLWEIKVEYFKMTDNRFGFGKKIIWQNS